MSTHEKFKAKIRERQIPTDIPFGKLQAFMLKEGFSCVEAKGDHCKFSHPGLPYHIAVDSGPKGVKFYSIKDVRKALDALDLQKGNEEA